MEPGSWLWFQNSCFQQLNGLSTPTTYSLSLLNNSQRNLMHFINTSNQVFNLLKLLFMILCAGVDIAIVPALTKYLR